MLILLFVIIGVESGVLLSMFLLFRESRRHATDARQERDLARQEVQALTDALARANRTPILRYVAGKKKLEPSDTWFGGKPQLSTVNQS